MNAKQYLKQAYKLNEQIECDKEELEALRALSTSISGNMTQERVQGSPSNNRIIDIISQIIDLENEIDAEIEDFIALKKQIRDVINQIEDVNEKLVLKYRYLIFLQWDEICVKMNYSKRQMYRIHDSALEKVKVPFDKSGT
jgi:DNA-directed RNA polymerase specialized sigma subunit